MADNEMISFTPRKIKRLKRAYKLALGLGLEVFTFEDHEYDIGYAKYLLEYLEQQTRSI